MKILHIIDTLGLGGAQTIVKGILEFQKDNKDIFLFALRKREINIAINHPNVIIFNSEAKFSFKPLLELKNLIDKEKIEMLHCHLPKSQYFGYLLKKRYFPKIKLIFHEHGDIFDSKYAVPFLIKKTKSLVNLFIAISNATKQKLIAKAEVSSDKIVILYNFVDLNKFSKANITWDIQKEKEKLGIKKDEFLVGFAGRLVERKGWRDFVEAIKILSKKETNFKFLIAGDGPDKDKMLKLIRKYKLEENIIYLGYQSNMILFYSMLDVFVIPSHWEPMGLVELEAQAMGTPVIASDVDGLNEVVSNKNCLLFNTNDSIDLYKKIILIKEDNILRDRLVENGLLNVREYSLNEYTKQLNGAYSNVQ